MNKEFYDKYSKDLECSSCITLTRCINEDRPLCTRGYIKFQEDTAIAMQKQITEKEKLIEEQKIRIKSLNEEKFLLKDDVQAAIKIQNKHDIEKAKLEAKLEETEELNKKLAEHSQSVDKALDDSCDVIRTLKQQLAESEKELEKCNDEWTKICDGKLETINRLIEEKHELQRQLTEKEKELAYMTKQAKKFNNEAQKYYEDAYCNDVQNEKAIVELEKVKEHFKRDFEIFTYIDATALYKQLDKQIAKLKGDEK